MARAWAEARGLPLVGISLGDPSGIGPEVTAAALALPRVRRALRPVLFGDGPTLARFPTLARYARTRALEARPQGPLCVELTRLAERERRSGRPSLAGGRAHVGVLGAAIEAARAVHSASTCPARAASMAART